MAEYVTYLDGGRTNAEGVYKYLNRLFTPGVPTLFSATSLQVSQRGAGSNMSVDVAVGDVMLALPSNAYAFWGYTDAVKNVTISAANATNPRIDYIVVYVDPTAYTSGSSNNPGALKFIAVAGTPAGSPAVPTPSAIQTAIGGTNIAYQILASVAVAANTTQITTANITDARTTLAPSFYVPITLGYAQITSGFSSSSTTIIPLTGLSATVNVPAGNRRVKITVQGALIANNTAGTYEEITLWDGTVGSGTQLQQINPQTVGTQNGGFLTLTWSGIVPAGNKTYNVGIRVSGGTAVLNAAATFPAFILVEAI